MMIIIVLMVIAIVLFVIAFFVEHSNNCYYDDTPFALRSIAVVSVILSVFFAIPAFFVNQCADATTAKYRTQYETLVYQLENGAYENVVEYSRKDLMNDICDYNSHVERGRILSKNPWVGVYYPEDWDNLPLIRLEDYR